MEDDAELELIEKRKLMAMRRRLESRAPPAKEEKGDRQVLEEVLYDRGGEVLEAAYSFYPRETERMVRELAGLVRSGRLTEKVSGGELYSIFRQLGLRWAAGERVRGEAGR
ncbi:MAG: hypothetical protein HY297_03875 [Thaumarchaeota archaeon]|nr:hypothetical protein [Nitrososphaerota archaeon]